MMGIISISDRASWLAERKRQPAASPVLIFLSSTGRFLTSDDSTPKRKLSPVIPEEASTRREKAEKAGGAKGSPDK